MLLTLILHFVVFQKIKNFFTVIQNIENTYILCEVDLSI